MFSAIFTDELDLASNEEVDVYYISLCFLLFFFSSFANAVAQYEDAKKEAERIRAKFEVDYKPDLSSLQKEKILEKANLQLQRLIVEDLAPPWYGTHWDFNGTTQEPGKGNIACGYFVTTLLRDVGVNLERIKLAQQASENIIKSLVLPSSIHRFSNKPIVDFLSDVKKFGLGIYLVGLDQHVGFISVEDDGIYFIHSSYLNPYAVVREVASESTILVNSKYRVVGKLGDRKLLEGWFYRKLFRTIGG